MLQGRKQVSRNKNNFMPESFEILDEMDTFLEKQNLPTTDSRRNREL